MDYKLFLLSCFVLGLVKWCIRFRLGIKDSDLAGPRNAETERQLYLRTFLRFAPQILILALFFALFLFQVFP